MRLTASFRRSEFNWPGNRKQQVTPDIVAEIRWFKSPTAHKEITYWHYIKHLADKVEKQTEGLTARSGELKGPETDVVESFIVKNHALICVFNQLMD